MIARRTLSRALLAALVARAATLDERLSDSFEPANSPQAEDQVNRRLAAWRQAAARGDEQLFLNRLAWDRLDPDAARRMVGPVRLAEDAPLPGWTEIVGEAVLQAASPGAERFLDAHAPLPFEEILSRFVLVARRRLGTADGYQLLSAEAHAKLERGLLRDLAEEAAEALFLEFAIMRSRGQSFADRLLAAAATTGEKKLYPEFVARLEGDGLFGFFETYPVLARLLGTITLLWVEAHVELLARLAADLPLFSASFGRQSSPGYVTALEPALSDPHHGRRTVLALTFTSGLKLVYKPKHLGMEVAFGRLLAWLNEQGAPIDLLHPAVLDRGTHGWVEFVAHAPCADVEAARRYYRRAGALLALVYVLGGSDFHSQNVVAAGQHPVLVDVETLLQPRTRVGADDGQALPRAWEQIDSSVLTTDLLPGWWIVDGGKAALDVSGLGGEDERREMERGWQHTNTDRMSRDHLPAAARKPTHRPALAGVRLRASDHVGEVISGFEQMYRFLIERRSALLQIGSRLYDMARQPVRFVYRDTRLYQRLLRQLRQPAYLADGAEWSIGLELLAQGIVETVDSGRFTDVPPDFWAILRAEQEALKQGDVPLFTASSGRTDLEVAPGSIIAGCFVAAGFSAALERLAALGEDDLAAQVAFIRGAFYSYQARAHATVSRSQAALGQVDEATAALPLAPEELLTRAVAIAAELRARAIRGNDGSATWIAPVSLGLSRRTRLQPVAHGLYDGACGIALFLAALEYVTGGAGFRDLALGALRPLRYTLRRGATRPAAREALGAGEGIGSLVYSLAQVARMLRELALLEDAGRAASLITEESIAADTQLDVIRGSAGAILGLLALDPQLKSDELRGPGVACGEHLLGARAPGPRAGSAWPILDGRMLTGFSHGAAGIAYALLRLYGVTEDDRLLEAAREAVAYESSVFSPAAGNWPDFLPEEQPAFMTTWCHGAPGIGLARLGGLPMLDTGSIREDIEIAMRATRAAPVWDAHHLCCGNMGLVEVLLVAGQRLGRPDLLAAANARARATLARMEQSGAVGPGGPPVEPPRPGFFPGLAGVGYQLLRLAYPDKLPSVLLWDSL